MSYYTIQKRIYIIMTATAQWMPLTTTIESHLGLQFGVNIASAIALDRGNYVYKNIAKNDIAQGTDVDLRTQIDSFYEVDGERLATIGKYGATSNKVQCYTGKNMLKDNATVYYTQRGALMVKESDRVINTVTSAPVTPKNDIFATLKRA
jgi:hypothetical protein